MSHRRVSQVTIPAFCEAILAFKTTYCNENVLIGQIIKGTKNELVAPILDVGAGLGDIAYFAYPDLRAILLDIRPIAGPISPMHTPVLCDFFDHAQETGANLGTLVLSHVLQYLVH